MSQNIQPQGIISIKTKIKMLPCSHSILVRLYLTAIKIIQQIYSRVAHPCQQSLKLTLKSTMQLAWFQPMIKEWLSRPGLAVQILCLEEVRQVARPLNKACRRWSRRRRPFLNEMKFSIVSLKESESGPSRCSQRFERTRLQGYLGPSRTLTRIW